MSERLRLGTFLAPRMRPLYEHAAASLGADLVDGDAFGHLEDGTLDAAFLCGLPYVGLDGVEALVAPVMDDGGPVYWSDVVARRGEQATAIEQFAGRRLAVNEPDSHSGSNVVLAALAERGVPVGGFSEVARTGSHAGSLTAVRAGQADVAAVDSHLYAALRADDPVLGEELVVVEQLGPSPSQPLAAGPGLGGEERERIRATLTALDPGELGMTWAPVDDATYDPIRAMRAAAEARGGF
jgi:ABC-type phosphate/phosphonate transport system substrate-binding protein